MIERSDNLKQRDFYVSKLGMPILVTGAIDDFNTSEGTLKVGLHKVTPKHKLNDYDYEWEMVELTTGLKLCTFKATVRSKILSNTEFINKAIQVVSTKQDVADKFKQEIIRLYKDLPEYLY